MFEFLKSLIYTDTERFLFLSQCQFHIEQATDSSASEKILKKVNLEELNPKYIPLNTTVKIIRVVSPEKEILSVGETVKIEKYDESGFPMAYTNSGILTRIYPDAYALTTNAYHNVRLKEQNRLGILAEVKSIL
ncbi:hypothetical protein ACFC9N_10885 [Enterococcus casseliflavus]|uniref:hypothetical protein n=1 Tax=Enterococcus TaxID=1350 RepID=UPI000A37FF6B|nr:hypothetical protein [Enterococcus sp. 4E1_DIV0656]OTO09181.1 hypothetical protein A5882_003511 [Enterococcus sp. 4E1_DIV0656]